jgi:hypothetical protein
MPDLAFTVRGVEVERFAAAPFLKFRIGLECPDRAVSIRNVLVQCQIRIETSARSYGEEEKARLVDLFGAPEGWDRTLQSLLWTHASTLVPAFVGSGEACLLVPCSFDFNVATTKYFCGLAGGEIPLLLFFSGAVFHDNGEGLQIGQIAWDQDVRFRLPVSVWKDMMSHYYPESAWLQIPHEVLDRLRRYKERHGLIAWEQALERLLNSSPEEVT